MNKLSSEAQTAIYFTCWLILLLTAGAVKERSQSTAIVILFMGAALLLFWLYHDARQEHDRERITKLSAACDRWAEREEQEP